jgi:hypothetical protein
VARLVTSELSMVPMLLTLSGKGGPE